MNRYVATIVGVVALSWLAGANAVEAQVYTTYYPAAPMPVTTYYAPTTAYYAPTTTYYAPSTAYYAPAPVAVAPRYYATPVTYYRPILGGTVTRWRYAPTPTVAYRYPVTTAYYVPAY